MLKCTCGNLGHGLCSDWCDLNQKPDVPVYDVTGTVFEDGETNFTIENLWTATERFGISSAAPGNILLKMSLFLYDRCNDYNLIDHYDGIPYICGLRIKVDTSINRGPITDIQMFLDGVVVGILRVREW